MNHGKRQGVLIATAVAALFQQSAQAFNDKLNVERAKKNPDEIIRCYGANSCKGKTACDTKINTCSGQNACKGKGFLELSGKECKKQGGKLIDTNKKPS